MIGSRKNRTVEPDLTCLLKRQTLHVVPKFLSFSLTNVNQYDAKTFIRKCLLKRLANEKTREIRSLKKKQKNYQTTKKGFK